MGTFEVTKIFLSRFSWLRSFSDLVFLASVLFWTRSPRTRPYQTRHSCNLLYIPLFPRKKPPFLKMDVGKRSRTLPYLTNENLLERLQWCCWCSNNFIAKYSLKCIRFLFYSLTGSDFFSSLMSICLFFACRKKDVKL